MGCRPYEPHTLPLSLQREHLTWSCSETPGEKYTESALARTGVLRSKDSRRECGASAERVGTARWIGMANAAVCELTHPSLHYPKGNQTKSNGKPHSIRLPGDSP